LLEGLCGRCLSPSADVVFWGQLSIHHIIDAASMGRKNNLAGWQRKSGIDVMSALARD
jgi:hypothetical protein